MSEKVEIHAYYTPEDYANALVVIQQKQNALRIYGIIFLFISIFFLAFLYWLTGPEFFYISFQ